MAKGLGMVSKGRASWDAERYGLANGNGTVLNGVLWRG